MSSGKDSGIGTRAIFTTLEAVNELAWRLFYTAYEGFAESDGCSHMAKNMEPSQLRIKDRQAYEMLERFELTLRLAQRDYQRQMYFSGQKPS